MKINSLSCALLFGALVPTLVSSPLGDSAAVHVKADAASATITTLKSGTEPKIATAPAPAGWIAVELAGPHGLYVQNKEITKALDVRPGADLRSGPKADAPVVATALAGDSLEITELVGRWTKVRLNRSLVGYIKAPAQTLSQLPAASVPASARVTPAPGAPTPPPIAAAPSKPAAYGSAAPGQAAPMVSLGDDGGSALPRSFQGRFVSTKSAFKPRRPYDSALTDESGTRFAYLDISRILQTEQIEKYTDRIIAVFGATKPVPGTKDFVIIVESFQLK